MSGPELPSRAEVAAAGWEKEACGLSAGVRTYLLHKCAGWLASGSASRSRLSIAASVSRGQARHRRPGNAPPVTRGGDDGPPRPDQWRSAAPSRGWRAAPRPRRHRSSPGPRTSASPRHQDGGVPPAPIPRKAPYHRKSMGKRTPGYLKAARAGCWVVSRAHAVNCNASTSIASGTSAID